MISQQEILEIICTEAIEYGGLQEVPGHKNGGKTSFHSPKRTSRGTDENNGNASNSDRPELVYDLRLVKKEDGTFCWKD